MRVTGCLGFDSSGILVPMKDSENLLMIADSEHDANMLYAVGVFVPDPFIYLRIRGRCSIVMSDLEIDRARKNAPHCSVTSLGAHLKKLRAGGLKQPKLSDVAHAILQERRCRRVVVPHNFSLGLAEELKLLGVSLKVKRGGFFPQRERKSAAEVKKISAALMMAEVGMAEGMQMLRAAKISRDGRLIYRSNPLTSEKLRGTIDAAIIQAGGLPANTIVAGGIQACDPHERGYGPLRANEPIIIDIFPRSQKTGYFGDITRTVVRGRASDDVRHLYDLVARGQKLAFKAIRAGTATADVHQAVCGLFDREGCKTERRNGRMQGFFHGTGHGLGLEIHEAPRMGPTSPGNLQSGQVVTVEPGLYYPGIGGVRLEDVALVTRNGARNLTRFEKVLEL
jgi:Xaa-Pro aminopeptidase